MKMKDLMESRKLTASERFVSEVEMLRLYPVNIRVHAEDPLDAVIDRLFVPMEERNFGGASNALVAVCQIADRLGVTLHLEALPDEDEPEMDQNRLLSFYRRFGFIGNGMMFRRPKSQIKR